ncbi:hypothetical protein FHT86_002137 [Rhizobium sp. BK313]|uniref:hypothetical protein n=1 Tax=Rhizobium sp. BK313 TaxID=2587081 RepID=UPI001618D65E|nr:hypothetical protein [Rhizobium sp. BK313]MBB3453881.1 hypothetical protein [Rhizobium sp. BK313]
MADSLDDGTSVNPFDQIGGNESGGQPDPSSTASSNPFDAIGPDTHEASSIMGSFARAAERGIAPALGSLPAVGAGAEVGGGAGAAIGSAVPVLGTAAGAVVGGIVGGAVGGIGGASAISAAQDWALSKLPESWREAIGQDDRQQKLDQEQHPVASFLGGIAPYALTMRPGGFARGAIPENSTALQRILANPMTARVFGGAAMGGMEIGNEKVEGGDLDWRKIAVATGFGLVFNQPTRLGEALTGLGARPVLSAIGPRLEAPAAAEPVEQSGPTVAQAADTKVMGPGITEDVFHGVHDQDPAAAMTAQDTARTEQSVIGEQPEADLHSLARRIDPDTFARYDQLSQQREEFRNWIAEYNNPPQEEFDALQTRQQELQAQLDAHVESQNGYSGGAEARRLRAQIRDTQSQYQALQDRQQAFAEGRAQETPDLQMARQHMLAVDYEMRDLAPQVSAAYRRAAEYAGQGIEPEVAQPEEAAAQPAAEPAVTPEAEAPAVNPETAATTPTTELPASTPRPVEEQVAYIANDIAQKLVKAGRPVEEAEAAGQLLASRYQTRADRFGGALGTPEELYNTEGPEVRQGRQTKAPKELELAQRARGKINIKEDAKPVITLMRDANASTFIHETGHQWLEELMRDDRHELAPTDLKTDAQTVRSWLGVDDAEGIKTRQHEKFARGFEQYMREGVAPSPKLASVFAKFKNWLTQLYDTLRGLGKPINEDIRNVFDRLIATEPQRTVFAPERAAQPSLADIHEADAAEIEPHEADAAIDRINSEKQLYITQQPPEIINELENALRSASTEAAANGSAEAGPSEDGLRSVDEGGGGPDTLAAGGPSGEEHGPLIPRGNEAGGKGAGVPGWSGTATGSAGNAVSGSEQRSVPRKPVGSELAPSPTTLFGPDQSPFLDKAGNIRVENLTTSEDVARAIRDAADKNDDFIGDRRGVVTDGQVMDLADALGMDFEQLQRRSIGQAFNAEQIVAARKLLVQSATDVSAAMKKAATGTDEDVMAYALAKDRHQMIQGQVAGITAEAGRALRAFRNIAGQDEAAGVDAFLKTATGKTLFQLRQEAKLGAQLDTPAKVSKFMRDAQKRSFGRMVLEYWINGLISGPATHTTYMVGNTILALEKAGPETIAAATLGAIRRQFGREGETVRLGEVGAQLKGLVSGTPAAIKASIESLKTGVTTLLPGEDLRKLPPGAKQAFQNFAQGQKPDTLPFQPGSELVQPAMMDEAATFGDAMASAFGLVRGIRDGIISGGALLKAGGIEGSPLLGLHYSPLGYTPDLAVRGVPVLPVGSAIRLPGRFIAAIHSLFRSMNYSMELNARAYRMASSEGLSGTNFDARVADIRQNPPADMMEGARKEATQLTLMGHGSELVRAVSRVTNTEVFGFPLLKFIDPFVHIAGNVIDQSIIQRTPVGILAPEIRADLTGKNGTIAQDRAQARMLVGTALSIGFGSLAAEGLISGSGPTDPKESAMWRLAGNQAHSVRIGNIWYDTHRLGPMGMLMGVSADMYEVAHAAGQADMLQAAARLQHAFTQNVLDESFMRGPAELMQAVEDPGRYGEAYIRNFLSSFVPYSVGISQVNRAIDPYTRQSRTVMDAIKAKIPGLSETLYPRRDIWGEPMPNRDAAIGKGITAIYETQVSNDPVNQTMLKLGIYPSQPERRIRNVPLTDGEYDDFTRIAGRMTKMRLDAIVKSPDYRQWPDTTRRDVVTEVINQSREAARGMMLMKYPQIVHDATQARLAKLRGEGR